MGIIEALTDLGYPPTKHAGQGVMRGPCPLCQTGDDRFAAWVEKNTFECRRCKAHGNFRVFFQQVLGLDSVSAAAKAREYTNGPQRTMTAETDRNEVVDPEAWKQAVCEIIEAGVEDLGKSGDAKRFLRVKRGLDEESVRRFRLGLIDKEFFLWRNRAGLGPYQNLEGKTVHKVFLPAGIVVPHIVRGRGPVGLLVRCWDGANGRYRFMPGSTHSAMFIKGASDALEGVVAVAESYLCSMKLNADTGVAVVALGGVNAPLGEEAASALDGADRILLMLDNDDPGFIAAERYEAAYGNAVVTPVPAASGKDITEAWQSELDLRKFLAAAMRHADRVMTDRRTATIQSACWAPTPEPTSNASVAPAQVAVSPRPVAVEPVVVTCLQPRGHRHITEPAAAIEAVRRLASENERVAVGIDIAKRPDFAAHPKAGRDPLLSTLRLVALAAQRGDALLIDGAACSGALGDILAPVLQRKLVAHDAVRVWKHLAHAGVQIEDMEDTMLMWNALTNETIRCTDPANNRREALSVDSVLSRSIGVEIEPQRKTSDGDCLAPPPAQLARASDEVLHLVRLHEVLLNRLQMQHLERLYALQRGAVRAVAQLETNGMFFQRERHTALVEGWRRQLDAARAELPQGMDLHKPKGMDEALRAILPVNVIERWPKVHSGLLSSSEDATGAFPEVSGLSKLKEWKVLDKLVSTYGDSFAAFVGTDGRIRSTYSLAATKSGRLASFEVALQNVPRLPEFRSLFTPEDEESVLVVSDMSQAELRCFACLSGDTAMRDAYRRRLDLHRLTASQLLDIPLDQVTKDQRTWGRVVNLAIGYGQSASAFRAYAKQEQGLTLSQREAEDIRKRYLEQTYPGLYRFQQKMLRQARTQGFVTTQSGRVRRFESGDRKAFTASINHPCQGSQAEMVNVMLSLLPDRVQGLGRLINVVHDELVVECRRECAGDVAQIIEQTMMEGFLAIFPDAEDCVQGLTEAKVCENWSEK